MRATAYRATVEASEGLLLGGVKRHTSSWFCNSAAAVRWAIVIATGNRQSGRKVAPLQDVESATVRRSSIVHGCQAGDSCSKRTAQAGG